MSDDATVVLLIVFGLMLLAAMGLGYLLSSLAYDRQILSLHREAPGLDGLFRSETYSYGPSFEDEPEEDEPEPEVQSGGSLPVDPANPPTWRTYSPKNPDAPAKYCVCHHEPIQRDSKVLWWPNPATGGVDLLCERGVEEAEAVKRGD